VISYVGIDDLGGVLVRIYNGNDPERISATPPRTVGDLDGLNMASTNPQEPA
jgi:hypothetical protein